MNQALNRFLRYASIDTTSCDSYNETPSSKGQWILAEQLAKDLKEVGALQVHIDSNCYVYGKIPGNTTGQPTIALIAHMDTADAVPGRSFQPKVVHYTGDDLPLDKENKIVLSPKEFPELNLYLHKDLVVTDGTTVLGADDKAGIAEIMTAAEELLSDPSILHGDIWIVFTPDEEIGSGAELLQLDHIQADFGYTVDGGHLHEIEFENFNAASATITIKGRNVHPGYAKGIMKNAIKIAMEFHQHLPAEYTPELTEGYEGFFHLHHMEGNEENAVLHYLVRDHDREQFESKKSLLKETGDLINQKYGAGSVSLHIQDSYRNMKEIILQVPHVLQRAEAAIQSHGMKPQYVPIRGGTDGARLSFRGLPCPNLGTGGHNFHSIYEFIPVDSLQKMAKVLIEIVRARII